MIAFALAATFGSALALSPAASRSPAPSHGASAIEAQEEVELGPVSYDGHLGDSSVALIALERLGDDVLPHLLIMSSSKSPVARVVAAAGLLARHEPIARTVLSRLEHDDATVKVQRGCGVEWTTVGEAVRDLAGYQVLIRPSGA